MYFLLCCYLYEILVLRKLSKNYFLCVCFFLYYLFDNFFANIVSLIVQLLQLLLL